MFTSCNVNVFTKHVFSQSFQFFYNKVVYKHCVFPVIPIISWFQESS
jgi:hypothetical protein